VMDKLCDMEEMLRGAGGSESRLHGGD
jgi:hypothetical protein